MCAGGVTSCHPPVLYTALTNAAEPWHYYSYPGSGISPKQIEEFFPSLNGLTLKGLQPFLSFSEDSIIFTIS